jgi:hypothetical protein
MMRIVLHDTTPRDALDDAAHALGLLLVNIVPKADAYPAQLIYVTPDREASVHLVDEGEGGALAWIVKAEGDEAAAIEARWAASLEAQSKATEAAS